jgi:hypothetical protein
MKENEDMHDVIWLLVIMLVFTKHLYGIRNEYRN